MEMTSKIFVVEQGYIRAVVSARTTDQGNGVSIEVFGRLPENCWKEALRFDCFEQEPHWHRFPASGGGQMEPLAALSVSQSIATALTQLRGGLGKLMAALGYPEGSDETTQPAFVEALDQIAGYAEKIISKSIPAHEYS